MSAGTLVGFVWPVHTKGAAAPEEKSPIESEVYTKVLSLSLFGCVKNGARQRGYARGGGAARESRARSLMRAAYHNLISFNIWGETVGCPQKVRAEVVTPGVGPADIFTILIIVSAWAPVARCDFLPRFHDRGPYERISHFALTNNVSNNY